MERGYGRFYIVKESCRQARVTQCHALPHAHNVFLKDFGLSQEWGRASVLTRKPRGSLFGFLVLFIK